MEHGIFHEAGHEDPAFWTRIKIHPLVCPEQVGAFLRKLAESDIWHAAMAKLGGNSQGWLDLLCAGSGGFPDIHPTRMGGYGPGSATASLADLLGYSGATLARSGYNMTQRKRPNVNAGVVEGIE